MRANSKYLEHGVLHRLAAAGQVAVREVQSRVQHLVVVHRGQHGQQPLVQVQFREFLGGPVGV